MTVTSVDRAFQLLRAVPHTNGTLTALSRETGLAVATVSRLMETLEHAGAVVRHGKAYRIGPAISELADNGTVDYNLAALATGHLAWLSAFTNETAGVVEAVGDNLVHLGQVATEHDVAVRDWTGDRIPIHSGCIGFVVLAHMSNDEVDRYLAGELESFSPSTVTDPFTIRSRLAEVRRVGSLWTTDEYADGVTTVAAPVLDGTGRAVGALHVHGPSFRFPARSKRGAVEAAVRDRAKAISAVLGQRVEPRDRS